MRRRSMLFLGVLLVGTLVLSSCFSVRSFYWTRKSATPSSSINAVLNLRPYNNTNINGYPFVLIGTETGKGFTFGNLRVWDDDGNFDGPKTMVRDDALRNWVFANNYCNFGGVDASDVTGMTWTLFRTPDRLQSGTNVNLNAQTKFRVKVPGTASPGSSPSFMFFSGEWTSDDTIPGGADAASCTGLIGTTLPIVAP